MNKRIIGITSLLLTFSLALSACAPPASTGDESGGKQTDHVNKLNHYVDLPDYEIPESGINWPEHEIIPIFAKPAEEMDAIFTGDFANPSEKVAFVTLQGIVNRKKPRIILYESSAEEKPKTWMDISGFDNVNVYTVSRKFELFDKYKDELAGVVIYSAEKSIHYLNLAQTIANINDAIPMENSTYQKLKEAGVDLPIIEDISGLEFTEQYEIYQYLYDTYWKDCSKRIIVSVHPYNHNPYIRDMAAAVGAAVVWINSNPNNDGKQFNDEKGLLDNTTYKEQKELLGKFYSDMTPGKSIVLGWHQNERDGIGTGTENGISTIPSDYYSNSTVLAALDRNIDLPTIPKADELENKVYIAAFLSDGDNIQYCQHSMYNLFEKNDGAVPVNWTISPGLSVLGPSILSYYYQNASENDFFASGPSGLGYALIFDSLDYAKLNMDSKENMDAYVKMSDIHMQRSGLRIITAWDQIQQMHIDSYSEFGRNLYGLTMQDWRAQENIVTLTASDKKLASLPNDPCYAMEENHIFDSIKGRTENWAEDKPMFFTVQGNAWNMGADKIVSLQARFNELNPGKYEFLRGDHFFKLYNEANNLPFNLGLSGSVTVTSSDESADASKAMDGSPTGDNRWVSSKDGDKWLLFDLGGEYEISRYIIRHAGYNSSEKNLNTKSYTVEVSMDGENWELVDDYRDNTASANDIELDPVRAKYVRINITDPGADGTARIGEVEIYGSVIAG